MNFYICRCGAVTIEVGEVGQTAHNSMSRETFDTLYGPVMAIPTDARRYTHCNHCVNHWGIDICACGSGEPAGKCDNDYDCCRAGQTTQEPIPPEHIKQILAHAHAQ